MKFPGENKIEFNMATTKELICDHLSRMFSAEGIRVTSVNVSGSYSTKTLDVTLTTDPKPTGEVEA